MATASQFDWNEAPARWGGDDAHMLWGGYTTMTRKQPDYMLSAKMGEPTLVSGKLVANLPGR